MRSIAICVLVLGVSGCDSGKVAPANFVVRDSMGTRIVEYPGPPTDSYSITLSPEPLWRHGIGEGDHLFQTVWIGVLQPDGGAVVADLGAQEIVVLGSDGSFRSVLSGPGQGPSENRSIRGLHMIGQDTFLVEDMGNAKFMVFEDGSLARTVSTVGNPTVGRNLRTLGLDSMGDLLMTTGAYRSDFEQPWLQGHLARVNLDGLAVDTVAAFDMAPHAPRDGPVSPFLPYGVTTATGGMFVFGRSDIPELVWRTPNGEVRQILRWTPERTYPTDQDMASFQARLEIDLRRVNPGMPESRFNSFIQEQLARYEMVPDEPLPLFLTLDGDGNGGVRIGVFVINSDMEGLRKYALVSPDAEWLGTVELPVRFRMLDIAFGRVLGILSDEMDVQSVAVYDLDIQPSLDPG